MDLKVKGLPSSAEYKSAEAVGAPYSICWIRPQNAGRGRRWEEKLSIQREVGVNRRLFTLADGEQESRLGGSAKGVAK